jgi:prepilin peptidase CpaA
LPAPLPLNLQLILILLVLAAAFTDIRSRRIPNILVLMGLIAGFAANMLWLGPSQGLLRSAGGLGLAMLIYFPLYLLRGMAAGDVKLMAAIGSITGAQFWLWILVGTGVFGLLAGITLALAKGRFRSTLWNMGFIIKELASLRAPYLTHEQLDVKHEKALRLPHGAIIAAGTILILIAVAIRYH